MEEKVLVSVAQGLVNRLAKLKQDKDEKLISYFRPYYAEVEELMSFHLPIITHLNREVNSYSANGIDDMAAQMEALEEHNKRVFEDAEFAANGQSLEDMVRNVENLVIRLKGTIHDSLVVSLEQYASDLHEVIEIGEAHFVQNPCQNILNLTREFKNQIPKIHANSKIE